MRIFGAVFQYRQSPDCGLSRSQHPLLHHRPTPEMPSCICLPIVARKLRARTKRRLCFNAQSGQMSIFRFNCKWQPSPWHFMRIPSGIRRRSRELVFSCVLLSIRLWWMSIPNIHNMHIFQSSKTPTVHWPAIAAIPVRRHFYFQYPFHFRHVMKHANSVFYSTHSYPQS